MSKLYTSIILIATALFFMSNSGGRGNVGNEAVTNAPGENGRTCGTSNCHDDGQFSPSVSVELLDETGEVSEVYKANLDYTARITISTATTPVGYGFQMVAVNAAGDGIGEWGDVPAGTQTVTLGGKSYVEHGAILADPVIEIPWTAPSSDQGDVSFYISANAVNENSSPSGDGSTNSNFTFTFEDTSSVGNEDIDNLKVYPNPTADRLTIENTATTTFVIFNAQGKLALGGSMINGQIDVSSLNEGIYFLQLERGKQLERFIKL